MFALNENDPGAGLVAPGPFWGMGAALAARDVRQPSTASDSALFNSAHLNALGVTSSSAGPADRPAA
jgi:hypothetical protein